MKDNLLLHILSGEASTEEKKEFYHELKSNKKERELFFQVKSLWLRSSLQQTSIDVNSEFEVIWRKIKYRKKESSSTVGQIIFRYAAVVILLLTLGGIFGYFIAKNSFNPSGLGSQKYTATRGSVSIVEFSDGTKVWLNSESILTYHEDRESKQRLAKLTGEAYFEVVHRDDSPFIVTAGNLLIHDLGTTFNIKAYPEDKYIETSLVEGKVDILTQTGKNIIALNPGESAMYFSDENRLELRTTTDNVLSAWRDGKFVIRDQCLEDIFKELSRWYGIEFHFENDKLRKYRFTGNIKKTTTVLHVLKVLKATTYINYRIIENVDKPDVVVVY
uniref:FecR family protein n=1 Tax=uncultured Draconibacterium sp. TaxID=1573823 RepID=UPI003217DC60